MSDNGAESLKTIQMSTMMIVLASPAQQGHMYAACILVLENHISI